MDNDDLNNTKQTQDDMVDRLLSLGRADFDEDTVSEDYIDSILQARNDLVDEYLARRDFFEKSSANDYNFSMTADELEKVAFEIGNLIGTYGDDSQARLLQIILEDYKETKVRYCKIRNKIRDKVDALNGIINSNSLASYNVKGSAEFAKNELLDLYDIFYGEE